MADTKTTQASIKSSVSAASMPDNWPGAFGIFHYSRDVVRLNLDTFIILWLLDFISSIFRILPVIGLIISILFGVLISISLIVAVLASIGGQKISWQVAIREGWPFLLRRIGLDILIVLSVVGGLILLIVPGLIILPRLALAEYFLIDKNLSIMDAYKASWNATKGHSAKIWGVIGVNFLMFLPAITIIGIVATVYLLFMYWASFGLLYMHINKKQPAKAT